MSAALPGGLDGPTVLDLVGAESGALFDNETIAAAMRRQCSWLLYAVSSMQSEIGDALLPEHVREALRALDCEVTGAATNLMLLALGVEDLAARARRIDGTQDEMRAGASEAAE